jgi:hypothetical protein
VIPNYGRIYSSNFLECALSVGVSTPNHWIEFGCSLHLSNVSSPQRIFICRTIVVWIGDFSFYFMVFCPIFRMFLTWVPIQSHCKWMSWKGSRLLINMAMPYIKEELWKQDGNKISLVLFCEFLEFCLNLLWLIILEGFYHGAEIWHEGKRPWVNLHPLWYHGKKIPIFI